MLEFILLIFQRQQNSDAKTFCLLCNKKTKKAKVRLGLNSKNIFYLPMDFALHNQANYLEGCYPKPIPTNLKKKKSNYSHPSTNQNKIFHQQIKTIKIFHQQIKTIKIFHQQIKTIKSN